MAETLVESGVAPTAAAPSEAEAESAPTSGGGVTVLRDRYEIHCDRPLPAFDTPMAGAYGVRDRNQARGDLMALVSRVRTAPRTDILPVLRKIDCPSLMRPIRWGVVDWPPTGGRSFAVIYTQPAGGRVMESICAADPIPEHRLMADVARPIVAALEELSLHGIAHRAIRPDNLYFNNPVGDQVMLGDAAMAPPGSTQPLMFETIENAMTHPLGRGAGKTADDLYALGVTFLVLLLGRNPVAELGDVALLDAKITDGSYAALVGDLRVPQTMREAMRGLLADDRSKRWTLDDLSLWLDGRRLTPLQAARPKQASRPFVFDGTEYTYCRALARAMARNWKAVPEAVKATNLEIWVRRSVNDPTRADAVAEALSMGAGDGTAADNLAREGLLAGAVCMALDPSAPIRYKNLSVAMDGLGPLLFGLASEANGCQRFTELIHSPLLSLWINMRYGEGAEGRALIKQLEQMRRFLKRGGPGFGIERCLYELNPSVPCQSLLVEPYCVVEADDLLPTLEAVVARGEITSLPTDRHVAAFIASRFGSTTESDVAAFCDRDNEARMTAAVLRTFALMQWRLGPPRLPALTALVGRSSSSLIDAYHGESIRKQLRARVGRTVERGNLSELQNLIDDPNVREQDERSFAAAKSRYAAADAEIAALEARGADHDGHAEVIANRIAALASAAIAVTTVAVLVLPNFF
jgi:hypothetical protein